MKMIIRIQIATLIFGLSASMTFGQTHHRVTERDCNMFFPRSHSNEMTRSLDTGVSFAEVWEQGSGDRRKNFTDLFLSKRCNIKEKHRLIGRREQNRKDIGRARKR